MGTTPYYPQKAQTYTCEGSNIIKYTTVWQFCLYLMGEYYMCVGCQYERVRYSGGNIYTE